jgi:hypothetical protein
VPKQTQLLLLGLGAAVLLWLYSRTKRGAAAADATVGLLDMTVSRIGAALISRGYRNNNPGNIRFIARNPWQGQVGNDGGYGIYDTPQNGTRALGHQLKAYGTNTVNAIITKWAPAADSNNTVAYIADVAAELDIDASQPFDVNARLADLAAAIARHENGYLDTSFDMEWVYL